MPSNLERYKKDFARLSADAIRLQQAFAHHCYGKEYEKVVLKHHEGDAKKAADELKALPDFFSAYQSWYSESLTLIKQLLPERLADFIRLYEKPKGRKEVGFENYRIEDALQGLRVTRLQTEVIADAGSAMPHLRQQVAILNSLKGRFESSLYDIRALVQADLFDSELDAARELLKHKFTRAAGAIAGVVLEKHLHEVCAHRNVRIAKKNPTIADYNEALKSEGIIDTSQWRFNQHLGDIRNLCDHNKDKEPTPAQVSDLIDGVAKVTKTIM
ncbi:hypothetical protein LMG26858_01649 [Achromobacter anxifer]|uniref:DUF4145 domain-containing protein n=1 Tax=Achromobacter anxifer TaxID=1287737 RepID=A0A6S7CIG5_9BURK|nr:hypothetical protein [Achromobacter anxifer]CAB3849865.1 hypothetical protein LMG26858_01649 [Achromobacter anxifer]